MSLDYHALMSLFLVWKMAKSPFGYVDTSMFEEGSDMFITIPAHYYRGLKGERK